MLKYVKLLRDSIQEFLMYLYLYLDTFLFHFFLKVGIFP